MNRGGGNEFTELLPKSTTSAYEVIVNGVAVKIPSTGCATKVAGLVRALKFKREASVRGFNINLTKYFTDVFSSLSDSQHLKLTPLEWAKARAEAKDKAEAVEAAA